MNIKEIAFLGDSITLGYGLDSGEERYSTLVCKAFGCAEDNFGMTGTLVAESGLSRGNGTSFVSRYAELPDTADICVVFGGTNDYFWSDTDLGGPDSVDVGCFFGAMNALCRGLKEKYKAGKLIFVAPYKMRGTGNYKGAASFRTGSKHNSDAPNIVGRKMSDYVAAIKTVCGKHGIPVLDLYENFGIDIAHCDEDCIKYTNGGCHLNPSGNRLIADALIDFIIRLC